MRDGGYGRAKEREKVFYEQILEDFISACPAWTPEASFPVAEHELAAPAGKRPAWHATELRIWGE